MQRTAKVQPRPKTEAPVAPLEFTQRWYARLALLATSVLLLSLALAPLNQFYLAWVGLAPLLVVLAQARSKKSAFAWGFLGGLLFFMVNMWWLWFVSPPGLFALTIYLAIFWGLAGLFVRALLRRDRDDAILHPLSSILSVALVGITWVALEWLRGNVSFLGRQGLPWLYLGQTQSPLLVMCQIADTLGVLGVTFWVVLVNALIALTYLHRDQLRRTIPAAVTVALVLVGIGAYGAFRLSQKTAYPGPTVLVVQSNYKQSNTGEKGAPAAEIERFHVDTTRRALEGLASRGQRVDLVVWSETMMPPLNPSARDQLAGSEVGERWQRTYDAISRLAADHNTAVLVGGLYHDDWHERDGYIVAGDRRNTAFFFDASGRLSETRYDKVHLVPFGEYIPFKHSIPPLYRLFIKLGPNYYEEYALTRGDGFTVFELPARGGGTEPARFVVPICFEDIVPGMVASMLHAPGGGGRRADFLVNITNDGWFRGNQMSQHLQAALFRSIENRVPTARSVNTGVSGFVDPVGRVTGTVPAETEGWGVRTLPLDRRVAPYTRIGDAFPITCLALTAVACAVGWARRRRGPVSGAQPVATSRE